jgi:hypothetical protein
LRIIHRFNIRFVKDGLILLLVLWLAGCQDEPKLGPAPLDTRQTLEQLAGAYNDLAQQIPTSPSGLRPKGRKKFVEDVFKTAGFDYLLTLQALAKVPKERFTQYHTDMMELLFLPHRGLANAQKEELYSKEELTAIVAIEKAAY